MAAIPHITPWAGLDVATLDGYLEKRIEPILRSHVLTAMLRTKGRIKTPASPGKTIKWTPKYKRATPTRGGDMTPISFTRINRHKEAFLPWRSIGHGEAYSHFEELVNKGKNAVIKLVSDRLESCMDDVEDWFHLEFYQDGNSTTISPPPIHGLASFMTVTTNLTGVPVAAPNDSYANLTTNLGTYGGSWTAPTGKSWPLGSGNTQYHFWSPLVVDYESTALSATTHNWKNQWREAIRFLVTYMQILQSVKPDLILMDPELLRQAKDSQETNERFIVNQGSDVLKLGFPAVSWEGVDLLDEYGVTAGTAYALKFDKMTLWTLQKRLFEKVMEPDIEIDATRIGVRGYMNLQVDAPSYFGALVDNTA